MKLFTAVEFEGVLRPLLTEEPESPDDAVALVAFSMLCEPGDGFAGLLLDSLMPSQLLALLIDRAEPDRVGELLGEDALEEVEHRHRASWPELWNDACERWLPRLSKAELLSALAWMRAREQGDSANCTLVLRGSAAYPAGLNDLEAHRPHALWCLGNPELLESHSLLSIVGTRTLSRYGRETALELAAVAAQLGVTTVSGGAFGIDATVHEAAVKLDSPTIAIMAGGLANLYPKGNLALLGQVAASGLVFSECPPSVTPAKFRFLQRNRMIAALGQATIVVEAGKTSGALSTGNRAVALGRQVAVVPGPITSAHSVGCHDFLNEHPMEVQLLARPQQIKEMLGLGFDLEVPDGGLSALEVRALDTFGTRVLQSWEVQRLAGLTVKETQIALGSLEMQGRLHRIGSGYGKA